MKDMLNQNSQKMLHIKDYAFSIERKMIMDQKYDALNSWREENQGCGAQYPESRY